jgi:hypothetical protein
MPDACVSAPRQQDDKLNDLAHVLLENYRARFREATCDADRAALHRRMIAHVFAHPSLAERFWQRYEQPLLATADSKPPAIG